jgi:hypothetical protein
VSDLAQRGRDTMNDLSQRGREAVQRGRETMEQTAESVASRTTPRTADTH